MQCTAQGHPKIRDAHDQPGVLPVVRQGWGLVDSSDHLDERHEGEIGEAGAVGGVCVNQSPDQQESLSDILVRRPSIFIHNPVHNLRNLVDKNHHLVLEDLCGVRKILNVTVAEDAVDHAAGDHSVDARRVVALHILPDDLCTSLSEPQGQQAPNLDNGFLQNHRLHRFVLLPTLPEFKLFDPFLLILLCQPQGGLLFSVGAVAQLDGSHGGVPDHQQLAADSLDGVEHEVVGPSSQRHGKPRQQHADKQGLAEV
mmetsp:Transcript_39839/g.104313  ORF Transcript_39839/g.104313 Transcript_39839/m.104313 type:complete len:255 (-) Transcript_39839:1682-2446(-)